MGFIRSASLHALHFIKCAICIASLSAWYKHIGIELDVLRLSFILAHRSACCFILKL